MIDPLYKNMEMKIIFSLLENSEQNVNELMRSLKTGAGSTLKAINDLEDLGIIKKEKRANAHFYSLNKSFSPLEAFFNSLFMVNKAFNDEFDIFIKKIFSAYPLTLSIFENPKIINSFTCVMKKTQPFTETFEGAELRFLGLKEFFDDVQKYKDLVCHGLTIARLEQLDSLKSYFE
jgi:predicted transcriptional regulator